MRHLSLLFALLLIGANAYAQKNEKWELGLLLGATQGQTDLQNFDQFENNFGANVLLRYHLNSTFGLRGNVLYGKITGDDANYESRANRGFTYTSPLTEFSLMLEADLLGSLRYKHMDEGIFKKMVSPFIFGGVGYTLTNPDINYNEEFYQSQGNTDFLARIDQDKAAGVEKANIPLMFGGGVKIDLSRNWLLQVEAGLRYVRNDKLEGVHFTGNPDKNDTYSFTSVGLCYRFPTIKDSDHDGVADENDACPDIAGSAATMGCPDSDGDGIADKDDACPSAKGSMSMHGCPDTDGDGVADPDDACPTLAGSSATMGCPDTDGDGIADKDDACPTEKGVANLKGCPDTDGDGITDKDDACPTVKGLERFKGCPDTDGDGITDKDDACPTLKGLASLNGCPDADGDGIADKDDKCPNSAGPASNNGCPVVKVEDKKILEAAIYGVQFETSKSTIKANSFGILNQVADVMNRYPDYQLTIGGHTDSVGEESSNQKLSESRAKACYDYLISKGVAANRMTHAGYGENKPVADNKTAAGRAKNRRVEFALIPK